MHLKKSNLLYSRGITLKRVTNGGAHLRGWATVQHSSEGTVQWRRSVGDNVVPLDGPGTHSVLRFVYSIHTTEPAPEQST